MMFKIESLLPLVRRAGNILLKHYGVASSNWKQQDNFGISSIVTQADLDVEKFLGHELKLRFPNYGFYGEEKLRRKIDSEYVWYLDPLDGTFNFNRQVPIFGISLGLVHNGVPVAGILHFPKLKLTVWAEFGRGTYANGKRVKVSQRSLSQSLYWAGGYYKHKLGLVDKLLPHIGAVKIIDASSFVLAQIAQGQAEIYALSNIPYDVVAGVIAIQEAGGKVTDQKGKPYTIDSQTIVATNGRIHDQVVSILHNVSLKNKYR